MAIHSSILAWRIPWTEKPGELQSMGVATSWTQLSDLAFTLTHQLPGKLAESHALTIPLISYCGGDVLN